MVGNQYKKRPAQMDLWRCQSNISLVPPQSCDASSLFFDKNSVNRLLALCMLAQYQHYYVNGTVMRKRSESDSKATQNFTQMKNLPGIITRHTDIFYNRNCWIDARKFVFDCFQMYFRAPGIFARRSTWTR